MVSDLDYNTPEWEKLFSNLLDDIEEQQCVLLIGPEIIRMSGVPLHLQLREHLLKDFSDEITYFYERDGFLLFADKLAKEDVQRGIRRFYKDPALENEIDETLLKKIAQIPLHLVLSINPDNFLSDICYKYGVQHRAAYFHHRGDAVQEVELPSKEYPLFYQLFGRFSQDDSMVLDYDDLFHLLQATLGAPGLPEKLRAALQRAKTFVFLGFQFDKWYSQLLLRLLSGEKAIRKYALNTQIADAQTHTFLVKQFEIAFLGDEASFFQQLYEECQNKGMLRELTEPNSPLARRVIRFVQEGDHGRALEALKEAQENVPDLQDLVVAVSARLAHLSQGKGKMDSRDYITEYNRITDTILNLTRMLP